MKPILFVVSEKGYTWDEVILPYAEFSRRGESLVFATPTGGKPEPDPRSIKIRPLLNWIGYGTAARRSTGTPQGRELLQHLEKPVPLSEQDAGDYSAIYIAGGHGALFDLNRNPDLHRLILDFDRTGKTIGTLCHSSSTLAYVEKDGRSLIADKRVTGFPTLLEHFILTFGMVDKRFLPLPLWTGRELNRRSGKRSISLRLWEVLNQWTSVRDGHIVTGVGPKVGRIVARRMLENRSPADVNLA